MTAIKKRPFAFSCCMFLLFSYICFLFGLKTRILLSAFSVLISAILLISKMLRKKCRFALIYVLPPIIISCIVSIFFFSINYDNILTYSEKECDTEFVIVEENSVGEAFSSYVVQIQKINGKKANFKASLYISGKFEASLYSSHSAKLNFSEHDGSQNGYSYKYSYLAQDVYLSASVVGDITSNDKTVKLFPSYYFDKINIFFSDCLNKYIKNEESALCKALLLGNKDELSRNTTYNFRVLGLSHMLAVSGMHLSILVGSVDKLIDKVNIGKKKRYLLMILITLIYAGITGFSPSVKRAAFMLILYYLSFLVSKNHDSITALCSSVALLCFISPASLFDIGLWLSFLSTYGILAVALPVNENIKQKIQISNSIYKKAVLKLFSMLVYGIVPIMFSVPAIWLSYGETAVISPISNILFTPLLLIIMYTAPIVIIFSSASFIAELLAFIPALAAKAMLGLAEIISPYAPIIPINYDFTIYIIVFLAVSFFLLSLSNTKRRSVYFIPFVCAVTVFAFWAGIFNSYTKSNQKIIYSNTSDGDSFLVISQNKALLCDVSGLSYQNAKISEYYLGENHLTVFDGYVVTDYNGAGTETLKRLTSLTRIKRVYLPYSATAEEKILEDKFVSAIKEMKIETVMYDPNSEKQISFYGIDIDIKNVARNAINSPSSVCITFSDGTNDLSYIGMGSYTETAGKSLLTKLFSTQKKILFGSYGKEASLPITSLRFKSDLKLFFPTENVQNQYKKTIPKTTDVTLTKNYYCFYFN